MDTSSKKKSFSTPSDSQTSADLTSSGKGKSRSVQPSSQQTKTPTTAVQPPGQQAPYPMLPGHQMSDSTSSGKERSKSTPPSKGTSQSTPSGKGTSHTTPQGRQTPTSTALLQKGPLPNLLGQQSPPVIPPGGVFYYLSPTGEQIPLAVLSGQPMPPGQQVTFSTLLGKQLPHPGPSIQPGPDPLYQQVLQRRKAAACRYQIAVVTIAVILLINAIAWFILYVMDAVNNSEGTRQTAFIAIAVAFGCSIVIHSCGILCIFCCPSGFICYIILVVIPNMPSMVVAGVSAAMNRLVATAVICFITFVVSFVQSWLSYEWRSY